MSKTKNIYNTVRSAKFVLKPTVKQKEILDHFKKLKLVEFLNSSNFFLE